MRPDKQRWKLSAIVATLLGVGLPGPAQAQSENYVPPYESFLRFQVMSAKCDATTRSADGRTVNYHYVTEPVIRTYSRIEESSPRNIQRMNSQYGALESIMRPQMQQEIAGKNVENDLRCSGQHSANYSTREEAETAVRGVADEYAKRRQQLAQRNGGNAFHRWMMTVFQTGAVTIYDYSQGEMRRLYEDFLKERGLDEANKAEEASARNAEAKKREQAAMIKAAEARLAARARGIEEKRAATQRVRERESAIQAAEQRLAQRAAQIAAKEQAASGAPAGQSATTLQARAVSVQSASGMIPIPASQPSSEFVVFGGDRSEYLGATISGGKAIALFCATINNGRTTRLYKVDVTSGIEDHNGELRRVGHFSGHRIRSSSNGCDFQHSRSLLIENYTSADELYSSIDRIYIHIDKNVNLPHFRFRVWSGL